MSKLLHVIVPTTRYAIGKSDPDLTEQESEAADAMMLPAPSTYYNYFLNKKVV